MALSFPTNPTVNQTYQSGSSATYQWNGTYWQISAPNLTGITIASASYSERVANIQATPPTTGTGSFWYDIDTGNSYIKYNTSWVPVQSNTINATSASFAASASQAISSSRAVSASFATTSSHAVTAASASFATTSSFVSGAPNGRSSNFISARVNAGVIVTLDNLRVTITTGGNRGLSLGAVSTTFTSDVNGWYGSGNVGTGASSENFSVTTTMSNSIFGWNFTVAGAGGQVNIMDLTNNRFYRITFIIGAGYANNLISIERLL
jgi:hypothetical protein